MAPCVLREQIDAALQQVGIASNLQVNGLNQRLNVMKSRSLEARLRGFKTITDFDSRNRQKTNSAADCLIVVVIRVAVEIERARRASIEGIEHRTVGNIESIVRAGRADRKSSTHLRADRYIRQEAMVNTKGAVRQFVDPLRLEAFDENITRTEKFSDSHCYIIVQEIRELGVDKV